MVCSFLKAVETSKFRDIEWDIEIDLISINDSN
jgi:hypothetical protein